MSKRTNKSSGLVESARQFEETARQLRESREREGMGSNIETQSLGESAREFADNAENASLG